MGIKKTTVFLSASLLVFQVNAKTSYDPTSDLITAYCSSDVGEHTRVALAQAESLKETIEKIKDDPACNDVQAISTNLYNTLSSLGGMYEQTANSQEFKVNRLGDELQKESARLISEHMKVYLQKNPSASESDIAAEKASFSPSSALLTALTTKYTEAKVNLISSTIAETDPTGYSEQTKRLEYITNLTTGMQSLFGAMKSTSECSKNYGNILSQMGAQVLGAANTIYGGIVGAVLLAGSAVVSGTGDLITHIKYTSKIHTLTNTRLQYALGCSLEGIAKSYCEARDTQTLLDTLIDGSKVKVKGKNVFKGIELLTQGIVPYNKWVQRIVAGSDPTNSTQASERIAAFTFKNNLTLFKESITGNINETSKRISNLTGTPDKVKEQTRTLLIGLIGNLVSTTFPYSNSAGKNAYSGPFAEDLDCGPVIYFYSLGANRIKPPTASTQTCLDYARATYPANFANPPSIDQLKALIESLNIEADDFVNQRLSQVLEENPKLAMALYDSEDPRTLSTARYFVEETVNYLQTFRSELGRENIKLIRLVEKTVDQLNKATEIIAQNTNETDQISKLAVLLAPSQITFSVNNALKEIVKQDVDMKLKNGNLSSDDLRVLLKVTPTNGVDLFSNYFSSVQVAHDDAAIAKNMTKKNLEVFGSLFANVYIKNLQDLKKEWEKNKSPDVRRQLGINCLESLLVPDESKLHRDSFLSHKEKKLNKVCEGMTYLSTNPSQVPSLSYNELSKLSFAERVCKIYDFKRYLTLKEMVR